MFVSRPAVHPVEAPPLTDATENPPRVRMKDVQGMPGTVGGLALRFLQFMFALAALGVMASTSDFSSVSAFCLKWKILDLQLNYHVLCSYLVAATILQSLWSILLIFLDVYALLVKRSLQNPRVICLFAIGDGITSTLTFAAACASAGITVLIGNDLNICSKNNCGSFETATAMAFISWFAVSPSFLLNFWSLASR
ncbi:CASP-like protein 1 [Apostasia shenzhenica]|uniref:CASP-like protein n=1 Tax=Apostasia shenzhenica TaxID=1088818 RepID=A0A2I0ACY1_9ASPA|nr:CASP-like protein 1 [Apostasia shenzhenica]